MEQSADTGAPWVEKYRPLQLEDVVGNSETLARLQVIAKDGNMPNLILSGPPGTGKTTSILCLSRALLGNAFKDAVLELNASDDRGIDTVRNKIKAFAKKKVTLPPGRHKIIILDEADSMTEAAQQALRRTMELFSSTTRFALACNNSTKVIEPIQSRSAILRFTRLTDEMILSRLLQVCHTEKVPYTDEGLEAIVFTAEGDMRNALNSIQATYFGFQMVNDVNVFKVCDQPHPVIIRKVIDSCVQGALRSALDGLEELFDSGYSCIDIIGTMFRVLRYYDMGESLKLEMIKEIGFTHMRIADGVSTYLQLSGLCARLCHKSQLAP